MIMNTILNPYRSFIRGKTRIFLAWIFAGLLVFYSRDYPDIFGVLLCFNGATLRFWASGYLRKDSKLSVGGPYAYVRNPLFLGTYLMAIGAAVAAQSFVLFIGVSFFFVSVYYFIILDEEKKLLRIFGEPYELYCRAVPRFFPRILPPKTGVLKKVNPDTAHWEFSWKLAQKNKAYEAYLSFVGLIGFMSLVAYLWKAHFFGG